MVLQADLDHPIPRGVFELECTDGNVFSSIPAFKVLGFTSEHWNMHSGHDRSVTRWDASSDLVRTFALSLNRHYAFRPSVSLALSRTHEASPGSNFLLTGAARITHGYAA